jgi:hypothetical protein
MKIAIAIFLGVLVVAALVLAFVPLMGVTYAETEPYVATETFYRNEISAEEVALSFESDNTDPPFLNIYWTLLSECSVVVRNTDEESGVFRIEFDVATERGEEVTKVLWQELGSGEERVAVVRVYGDHTKSFTYSVTPPTKVVSEVREVPEIREVTKYRTVERTDTVSVFEYLRERR